MAEEVSLDELYPRLNMDEAMAVLQPLLPPFPAGPPYSFEAARDAYLWAKAAVDIWGDAAATFIQNAMSDAVRACDMRSFQGWAVVQIALADFIRVPADADTVH